eukprot:5099289-Amphidinium_carterae.4
MSYFPWCGSFVLLRPGCQRTYIQLPAQIRSSSLRTSMSSPKAAYLVLPRTETKLILDRGIDEAWGPVKDEVKFVYCSSASGRVLFAALVADICQDEVATMVLEALEGMSKQEQLTQKEFIRSCTRSQRGGVRLPRRQGAVHCEQHSEGGGALYAASSQGRGVCVG